jgi:hypothetical protein
MILNKTTNYTDEQNGNSPYYVQQLSEKNENKYISGNKM